MTTPFAQSDIVLVPRKPEFKGEGSPRELAKSHLTYWRGNWYFQRVGYKSDGASIPSKIQWLMGLPFDECWIAGATFHDGGYDGLLFVVLVESAVMDFLQQDIPIPDGCLSPIWMPPNLADQAFFEINKAYHGHSWWKDWVAKRAINLHHEIGGGKKSYITKMEWNMQHGYAATTHESCLNFIEQDFLHCRKTCEGFFGVKV